MKYRAFVETNELDNMLEPIEEWGHIYNYRFLATLNCFYYVLKYLILNKTFTEIKVIECPPHGTKMKVTSKCLGEIEITATGGGGWYFIS